LTKLRIPIFVYESRELDVFPRSPHEIGPSGTKRVGRSALKETLMMILSRLFPMSITQPHTAWTTLTMVPTDEDGGGSSAMTFADSELRSFAKAAINVRMINDTYSVKVGEAHSEEEKKQLEHEASGEMADAVRKEGLSLSKYQAIVEGLETDPELLRRVRQKLNGAMK